MEQYCLSLTSTSFYKLSFFPFLWNFSSITTTTTTTRVTKIMAKYEPPYFEFFFLNEKKMVTNNQTIIYLIHRSTKIATSQGSTYNHGPGLISSKIKLDQSFGFAGGFFFFEQFQNTCTTSVWPNSTGTGRKTFYFLVIKTRLILPEIESNILTKRT